MLYLVCDGTDIWVSSIKPPEGPDWDEFEKNAFIVQTGPDRGTAANKQVVKNVLFAARVPFVDYDELKDSQVASKVSPKGLKPRPNDWFGHSSVDKAISASFDKKREV